MRTLSMILAWGSLFVLACEGRSGAPPAMPAPLVVVLDGGAAPLADAAAPSVDSDAGATAADPPNASDGGGAFFACETSADCVAVPQVGCCHNGRMAAVARGKEGAYGSSFVCDTPNPICPQYIVNDARVPRCSPSKHACEMVGRGVFVK